MGDKRLVFLHLSDIHFRTPGANDPYDLDKDLRNELFIDVKNVVDQIGGLTGIFVTGDIAFSGSKEEFDVASGWLKELCEGLGCPNSEVYTVPGNHDVDRSVIDKSATLRFAHHEIRDNSPKKTDSEIIKFFRDDHVSKKNLFEPLKNYNDFASKFNCDISAEDPFWHNDFLLNDGSYLRVKGLNSTLVSDSQDNDSSCKLVLGSFQTALERQSGVEYVTLCHHPPSWLFDQHTVEEALGNRSKVQLFGHKHSSEILHKDNFVRITSGATHPGRREPHWCPRFNILTFYVSGSHADRYLNLEVYSRVWDGNSFKADTNDDGGEASSYPILLEEWDSPRKTHVETEKKVETKEVTGHTKVTLAQDPYRELVYRFLSLSYYLRLKIAQDLGILCDEDKDISGTALVKILFRRAKQKDILNILWDRVEECHGDGKHPDNPFGN